VPQGLRVSAPSPSPASARSHQPPCLREADKDPPAPAFESNRVAKLLPTLLSMSPATIATPPRPESAKKSPPLPIHGEPLLARLFLSIRLMPHCNLSFLELYEHPKAKSNRPCSLPTMNAVALPDFLPLKSPASYGESSSASSCLACSPHPTRPHRKNLSTS
jgi:hypothetical protein